MKKDFSILEYGCIYPNDKNDYDQDKSNKNLAVPKKVFEEIESFILKNENKTDTQADTSKALFLKPTHKAGLGKVLQAQNYVGVIQTKDGTTIEILPKIANLQDDKDGKAAIETKKIVLRMLKTLRKSPFKNFNSAHLKSSKINLLEVFIAMFLDEVSKLIRKGIKSDYIIKEENQKFLKGKLLINQQIKHNYIHKERFFVNYEEFSRDRVENKLIKSTLKFLYKKSQSNKNQQRIREFLFIFDGISESKNIKTDFDKIKPNRQMKDYELVLIWAKIFLLNHSFESYKGNEIAFALLFDMNKLFESYVGAYLKKKLSPESNIALQDKSKHLVYKPESFALKPDIVIKENSKIKIADTKWKLLDEEKDKNISQGDMYQLYAYGTKYENCNQLYLIYPKTNNNPECEYDFFENKELKLKVLFFDLKEDFGLEVFSNNFKNNQ